MTTPKPGTFVPQIPTLDRREGVEEEALRPDEVPPFDDTYIYFLEYAQEHFSQLDGVERVQFRDIAVGQRFIMGGRHWQRIAVTTPPEDYQTRYYFRANARLCRPPFPGAFVVEYIHLLDASLVERVSLPESSWELTPAGEKRTTSPENLN